MNYTHEVAESDMTLSDFTFMAETNTICKTIILQLKLNKFKKEIHAHCTNK